MGDGVAGDWTPVNRKKSVLREPRGENRERGLSISLRRTLFYSIAPELPAALSLYTLFLALDGTPGRFCASIRVAMEELPLQ